MITANKQIAALKYLIFKSKDGNELSKRVLAFLIDSSEGLTKDVCLSLVAGREGYGAEEIHGAADGAYNMQSCDGTTHLDQVFYVMGSELGFSYCYGDFDSTRADDPFNNDGQFAGVPLSTVSRPGLAAEGMPVRFTFWLSKGNYSRDAELVVATREDLESINLKKPGLYLILEPS
jgi:hypothetical protein